MLNQVRKRYVRYEITVTGLRSGQNVSFTDGMVSVLLCSCLLWFSSTYFKDVYS